MHPYEATLDRLRAEHRVSVDGMNAWSCSCGAGPRATSPNRTHGQAVAAGNRHVHAAHRRLIEEYKREAQQ